MTGATGTRGGSQGPLHDRFRGSIHLAPTRTGVAAAAILVALWLTGGIVHGRSMIATGWGDISPGLTWLALALVAWAGVTAWGLLPGHGRIRAGAIAGMATFVVTVLAQFVLVFTLLPAERLTGGDETWFSLLLESWFWIGIPLVVSASLGAFGWWVADRISRARGTTAR